MTGGRTAVECVCLVTLYQLSWSAYPLSLAGTWLTPAEKLVSHQSEHCIEIFNVYFHPHDYGVVDTVAQVLARGNENGYSRVEVHLTTLDVRDYPFAKDNPH